MRKFIVGLAVLATTAGGVAVARGGVATHGTAWVGISHTEGSNLYLSGDTKDSKYGRGAIVYITRVGNNNNGVFHVTAKVVTLYTAGGSISGTGSGDEVISGSSVTVKNGKFNLTKGTGTWKGHSFVGTFSGPQKNGVYIFSYKATYR